MNFTFKLLKRLALAEKGQEKTEITKLYICGHAFCQKQVL